jgi:hypothetical protein
MDFKLHLIDERMPTNFFATTLLATMILAAICYIGSAVVDYEAVIMDESAATIDTTPAHIKLPRIPHTPYYVAPSPEGEFTTCIDSACLSRRLFVI